MDFQKSWDKFFGSLNLPKKCDHLLKEDVWLIPGDFNRALELSINRMAGETLRDQDLCTDGDGESYQQVKKQMQFIYNEGLSTFVPWDSVATRGADHIQFIVGPELESALSTSPMGLTAKDDNIAQLMRVSFANRCYLLRLALVSSVDDLVLKRDS